MPIFIVYVENIHDRTVEEIHRAYTSYSVEETYEIEAEDEEEAIAAVSDGEGTCIDSETSDTEYLDSEYWSGGDVIYDECTYTNFRVEVGDKRPKEPKPEWEV